MLIEDMHLGERSGSLRRRNQWLHFRNAVLWPGAALIIAVIIGTAGTMGISDTMGWLG